MLSSMHQMKTRSKAKAERKKREKNQKMEKTLQKPEFVPSLSAAPCTEKKNLKLLEELRGKSEKMEANLIKLSEISAKSKKNFEKP